MHKVVHVHVHYKCTTSTVITYPLLPLYNLHLKLQIYTCTTGTIYVQLKIYNVNNCTIKNVNNKYASVYLIKMCVVWGMTRI